jgi:hypothetical protein
VLAGEGGQARARLLLGHAGQLEGEGGVRPSSHHGGEGLIVQQSWEWAPQTCRDGGGGGHCCWVLHQKALRIAGALLAGWAMPLWLWQT